MRTIVSLMTRPGAQQITGAAVVGDEEEDDRAAFALDDHARVQQQRSSLTAARDGEHGLDERAEHVGRRGRRGRLELEAGHPGERVQVGRADDVADLAQRRLGVLGVRLQAEQRADARRRRASAASARSTACRRARRARCPVISGSGGPISSTAWVIGSTRASGTVGRPSGRACPRGRSRRCRRRCSRARAARRAGSSL